MKTLKALLKELLSKGSNQNPDSHNQPNSSTQNQNQNETETNESARNPQLDNPSPGKDSRLDQGDQKSGDTAGATGAESGTTLTTPEKNPQATDNQLDKTPQSHEEALKEAYRKGEIAGRNAQIEEKYFPKTDDGVPQFRGRASKQAVSSDIFTMARNA